jgi:type VI secretion system (T6SS) effector TldE1-like protein
MSKGGPREGAGRPRGSRGKRTRDSIAKAEALGPTPLEVLLESMPARTRRRRAGRGRGVRVNCGLTSTRRSRLHPPLLRSTMNQIIPCCRMRNLSQLEKLFSKGAAPTAIHVATSRPRSRPFRPRAWPVALPIRAARRTARGALCVSNAVAPTYDKFTGIYDISARTIDLLRLTPIDNNVFGRAGLLAHTFMLGPNGDSKGCVSFRNYDAFLQAYLRGEVKRLAVVARLN